ncbi:uncharacterized protein [Arachis hypogaea]|uniref:uncharacterized protein n=1 Tax=Arachis hypogaea TaxID=3818 RepID=UPI000DEC96B8|nr:uncharacterized protein LOC112805186 [Arachis hypogaea]
METVWRKLEAARRVKITLYALLSSPPTVSQVLNNGAPGGRACAVSNASSLPLLRTGIYQRRPLLRRRSCSSSPLRRRRFLLRHPRCCSSASSPLVLVCHRILCVAVPARAAPLLLLPWSLVLCLCYPGSFRPFSFLHGGSSLLLVPWLLVFYLLMDPCPIISYMQDINYYLTGPLQDWISKPEDFMQIRAEVFTPFVRSSRES